MKNITDYFSNSEKENPDKEPEKDIDKKSKNPGNSRRDQKKPKSTKKKETDSSSKNKVYSFDGFVDENEPNTVNVIVLQEEANHSETSNEENVEQTAIEIKSDKKNAFQIMMESRNKSIGTNSPGKDLLELGDTAHVCDKAKKSARKKILADWAELKGGAKRKREDEEKEQIIKRKLEIRSKRLKKLLVGELEINESANNSVDMIMTSKKRRRKVLRKLSCSSNSSIEDCVKQKNGKLNSKNQDKELINETNKKLRETDSNLNDVLMEKEMMQCNTKNQRFKNIIVDESSQDSLNTPPALRSWRMRIKLNINDNDVHTTRETIKAPKINTIDLDEDTEDSVTLLSSESDEDYEPVSSKTKKIAPVFLQAAPKPKIDPEVLKARQEFLMSGTPSILKLKIQKQKSVEEKPVDEFPSISHIQQKSEHSFWKLPTQKISLNEFSPYKPSKILCSDLTNKNKHHNKLMLENSKPITDIRSALNKIKASNPDYPVYKSFRLISEKSGKNFLQEKPEDVPVKKKKKGRPKKNQQTKSLRAQDPVDPLHYAMWTDKYKPKSAEDIIGNAEALKKLKTWLETWKTFSQDIISKRSRKNSSSSEFETTDCDSRDSTRLPDNTITLGGPCGSGKSATIYAVCNQLGFNVIEINASSKRTGKKLLQDLQEATQSYQVRKKDKGIHNLFNTNKRKEETQESKSDNKMCVLLVEDVDIVFDQDDGFIIALQQLIATSKRPVILTTTDYSSNFSQKFLFDYDCVSFSPLQSSTLATWCQILCLIEGKYIEHDDIASLIDYNKGDIRKTLLQLQFWVQSGGQLTQETMPIKIEHQSDIVEDKIFEDEQLETSNDGKQIENENIFVHRDCFRSFEIFEYHEQFQVPFYLNLGFLWWNIPNIFGMKDFSKQRINKLKLDENISQITQENPTENIISKEIENIKLRHISNFYQSLSFADVMFRKYDYFDGLEPEIMNHTSVKRNSLELDESLHCHKDLEFMHELTHTLVNGYVKSFNFDGKNEVKLNVGVPHKSEIRWRTKHHVCEDLFRESLSPCTYVERKSAFLDYYSTLRNISRSEVQRAANNTKRRNRFRSYLRDLGIKCSENNAKIACKILKEID